MGKHESNIDKESSSSQKNTKRKFFRSVFHSYNSVTFFLSGLKMKMDDGGLSIAGSSMGGLEAYVVDANEALKFKFLRRPEDAENDDLSFNPEMTHQIYGDNENIFGYRELNIEMWMCASTLKAYLGMSYAERLDKSKVKGLDGVEPDPVIEPMLKIMAEGQIVDS